ncbi:hypothetical protein IGI04_028285 [Brassica rapa subsp. trilocularis]|uniref:Uncharacterized protein n=1 Tax=Brassica rapa subsp. trilocularis TaxID=1813537 RepID=A0ABQ7L4X6_BRACM|nr:hypothetical protein IGI04_028285 [Brassica rapa subsp. trilocularis]
MKNRWVDWKYVAEVTNGRGGGLIDGRETCGGGDYSSDNGYRSGDDYRIGEQLVVVVFEETVIMDIGTMVVAMVMIWWWRGLGGVHYEDSTPEYVLFSLKCNLDMEMRLTGLENTMDEVKTDTLTLKADFKEEMFATKSTFNMILQPFHVAASWTNGMSNNGGAWVARDSAGVVNFHSRRSFFRDRNRVASLIAITRDHRYQSYVATGGHSWLKGLLDQEALNSSH